MNIQRLDRFIDENIEPLYAISMTQIPPSWAKPRSIIIKKKKKKNRYML